MMTTLEDYGAASLLLTCGFLLTVCLLACMALAVMR